MDAVDDAFVFEFEEAEVDAEPENGAESPDGQEAEGPQGVESVTADNGT